MPLIIPPIYLVTLAIPTVVGYLVGQDEAEKKDKERRR